MASKKTKVYGVIVLLCIILGLSYVVIGTPYVKTLFKRSARVRVAAPALPSAAPTDAEMANMAKALPVEVSIPEGSGHIVEGYKAPNSDKVVIHIQDIHTNYEAQKNLSTIIESLIKEKGLKLIMVEGGWGNVSLSYLRSYADKDRRLEVAEEYLKAGKISGEEYLDIISDYDMNLEGLETEALYKANLDAFFEIEKFRQEASKELKGIEAVAERLKEKLYGPQVIKLEKMKKDYEDEKISLADYYKQLNGLAKKEAVDLTDCPNFNSFIKVTEAEQFINFPSVEKERSALIEKLSKSLSKQNLAELVTKSLEFRLNKLTPYEYHNYLMKEAEGAGEDIKNYPNLNRYLGYIKSHEEINTAELFEEAEKVLVKVKEKLIVSQQQKRLDEISTSLGILDNFLNLKLIPDNFKYYKEHKNDFITAGWVDFLNKQLERNKIKALEARPAPTVDKNLSTLAKFYDIANERDDIFVKNTIRLLNEKNQNLAVLIAGGFHTPSLKQKLKECGISYIIVAPHTTQQTDPEQYRHILKYKSGREE